MEIAEAKRRAAAGPALLLVRRGALLGINLLSAVVLARLLPPSAFGIATMATLIVALGQIFAESGLTNTVLRRAELDMKEVNFVFWFNAATTITVAAIIFACAPLVADFFKEPLARYVTMAAAGTFLATGLGLQHRALINRDLRFGAIGMVDIVAALVGLAVSLGVAFWRHDVWAIVAGAFAQALLTTIGLIAVSGWRPSRPSRPENLRAILGFGMNSLVFALSTFISRNIGAVLIGHSHSAAALGQYNRAQLLYQIPSTNFVQPMTQATIPLLTRLRPFPEEYRDAYLAMVAKLCLVLMPASVCIAFAGVPIALVVLGDKWLLAGQVLSALAPSLVAVGLGYAASDLFYSQDRTGELRTTGLVEVVLRVAGTVAGLQWGVVGAAAGSTVGTSLAIGLRIYMAGKKGPVSFRAQLATMLPALLPTLAAGIACAAVAEFLPMSVTGKMGAAVLLIGGGMTAAVAMAVALPKSRRLALETAQNFGGARIARLFRRRSKQDS